MAFCSAFVSEEWRGYIMTLDESWKYSILVRASMAVVISEIAFVFNLIILIGKEQTKV